MEDLKLEESELQVEIMKHIAEGVHLIKEDNKKIIYTNSRFEKMFGYEPNELIGKDVSVLNAPFAGKTPQEIRDKISAALKKDGEWHGEVKNVKKNGTCFWSYANVSSFIHPKFGKVIISIHTDITKEKESAMELENKINELEKTNKLMVGRELTMHDLKAEVEKLRKEIERLKK